MAYVELVDSTKSLKIGLPAVINIMFMKELEGSYKSNVVDIDFKRMLLFLSIPSLKGKFVPIPKGVRMTVSLFDRSSVYEFDTVSLGVTKMDNVYVIPVPFPELVRRTERRKFVRIQMFLDGRLYLTPEENAESFPFTTKNISAGGMMIMTKKYLNVDDIIYVDLILSDDLAFNKQKSRVVRQDEKAEEGFVYGLQFLDLSSVFETRLVKFIFQRELKMRSMKR